MAKKICCCILFGCILGGLLAVVAGPAANASESPTAALPAREQELLQQFRDLEKTFLRLADLLAVSDPRRAALLRSAFEQARDQEVGGRLDGIVQLLEKGQLLKAGTSQASAIEKLRELLDLLESGDSNRQLTNTKEEVKQFLARLSKLIARQRDIEGSTEAGSRKTQLAERQDSLAEETQGLARELGSFAKRMEARDVSSEHKPEKSSPEGKPPKGEGKPQDGEGVQEEQGDGKGSQPSESQGQSEGEGEGQSSEEKPASGKPGEAEAGSQGTQADTEEEDSAKEPDGDDESSRAQRTKRRLESAEKRMRKAEEQLKQANRRNARAEQEKAIQELETARAELEEILRQMREAEVERLLVQLETRLRAMLRAEKAVLAGAEKLAAAPSARTSAADGQVSDRARQLEAAGLGREQGLIGSDATKALTLVRDDGSAVAIPEALEQVRDDSVQAAARLARGDVGSTTRSILQDLVANLEEMLGALEKAHRQQQSKQQGSPGGRPAEPGEQPLVDKLSELKMIRSLQMRVNTRTKHFSQLLSEGAEQAEEPELLDAIERLAGRQQKIQRAAHDIVTGRTE